MKPELDTYTPWDTQTLTVRRPHSRVGREALSNQLLDWLLDSIHGVLQGGDPGFVEIALIVILGMAFGYAVVASAYHAIFVAVVLGVGVAWGMVLGLLLERLRPALIR